MSCLSLEVKLQDDQQAAKQWRQGAANACQRLPTR